MNTTSWPVALAAHGTIQILKRKYSRFQQQLYRGWSVQRDVLFRKVHRFADTEFGRDHHFSKIQSLAAFRSNVPVVSYDAIRPYIQKVAQGKQTALLPAGEKLIMFNVTSGTTGLPKLIPVTRTSLKEYLAGWQLWGIKAFLDHPDAILKNIISIVAPSEIKRNDTVVPCGMGSGMTARFQSPVVKHFYVVPQFVFEIPDVTARSYTAMRLAIEKDVGVFFTAASSTALRCAEVAEQYQHLLIRDIADGTLCREFEIPDSIHKQLKNRLGNPNPQRAWELERIVKQHQRFRPMDYWNLRLYGCWLGGTVGTQYQNIPDYFGHVPTRDLGLVSSEGRHTIPVIDQSSEGLLAIHGHYYEFLPEAEAVTDHPQVLEGHELNIGQSYRLIITTSSGLFRYNLDDIVRCTGFVGETPVLEFLQKGDRCSDLEGEKVTEFQVVSTVDSVSKQLGITVHQFTAVPHRPAAAAPRYIMLFESSDIPAPMRERFLKCFDQKLRDSNMMYNHQRSDEFLAHAELICIPEGSWNQYRESEVSRRGIGDDHFKHPYLIKDESILSRFAVVDHVSLQSQKRSSVA